MRVGVVGTGYVGLVSGVCLAQLGHTVHGVDIDSEKIALLKSGICPIFEVDLPTLLRENLEAGRVHFTTSLGEILGQIEVLILALGTPELESGCPDLSSLFAVAHELGNCLTNDLMIAIKSTVPVGTCEMIEEIINKKLGERKVDGTVVVSSNPEFLQEGSAVNNFMHPHRIIVGVSTSGEERMYRQLYQGLLENLGGKLVVMDRCTSELTKYAANALLASRVAFVNEIARLAGKVGANFDLLRLGVGLDQRIGPHFLSPGPGYGGSCFPKDVSGLISMGDDHQVDLAILKSVQNSNLQQKKHAAKKIIAHFNEHLHDSAIAILGLAFKPGTDDVRDSPALTIIDLLLAKGARVYAHDPIGIPNFRRGYGLRENLFYLETHQQDLREMDAIAIVTDWDIYRNIDWVGNRSPEKPQCVFDFRHQLDGKLLRSYGYEYQRI